jgi:hypothetical protein
MRPIQSTARVEIIGHFLFELQSTPDSTSLHGLLCFEDARFETDLLSRHCRQESRPTRRSNSLNLYRAVSPTAAESL